MARRFGRSATTTAEPKAPIKVLRADGARIDLTRRDSGQLLVATRQAWQSTAWGYRDLIGELRYAIRLLSRSVARVRFYVAETQPWPADPIPLDDPDAETTLDAQLVADAIHNFNRLPLDTNPDGFTARFVENLSVAGESWVHIDPADRFWVRSTSEVTASADGRVVLNTLPSAVAGSQRQIDPEREDLLRCWVPHPEWGQLADSPLRVLLDVCEDVVLAGREQRAAARSRVAANGVLLIPTGLSLLQARDDDQEDGVEEDTFMADLTAAMLAPIRDDGDAQAVVPIVMRGETEDLEKVRHLTLQREDSGKLIERQSSAILRLLKGLDIQPEQVEGLGDVNHWCVDDQTEILTARGWLRGDQLVVGDVALTLNHDTGLSQWQPVQDIYRANVVDEPMVSMEGRRHSSLTTPQHRWPVLYQRGGKNRNVGGEIVDGRRLDREWRTSETLDSKAWIPTAARSADQPDVAKYSDDLVELVAWFWTEGNISTLGSTVSIAQSHTRNPERVARIRAALTRTFGPARDSLRATGVAGWRERVQRNTLSHGGPITVFYLSSAAAGELLAAAPNKIVSREFVHALTPAQLELFIDISAQGDGWHYRSGRLDMWQRNREALEGYELALILSGRMVTRGESDGGYWVSPHNTVKISPPKADLLARKQRRAPQVTQQRYTGLIWCPVTPNGTWFARRRGTTYFTGNSAWAVDARSIRDQVEPMAETVAACLTQAYLRAALLDLGHDEADVNRVTIAADPSPLSENPNRGQDARDAHDRMAISDASLREALGFDDDDAPADDEVMRRLAVSGALPPALSAALLGLSPQDAARAATIEGQITPTSDHAAPALPGRGSEPAAQPGQVTPTRTTPPTPERDTIIAAADTVDGWIVDVDLARQLADIDAALADRIATAADAALARVLERAGARVRSAAQKDRQLAASLAGIDAHRIPAHLGRPTVEGFVPIDDLLADGYQRLRGQVIRWLADAAAQVADLIVKMLRLPGAGPEAAQVRAQVVQRLEANTDKAWAQLAATLDTAAERAMFQPDPFVPDVPDRGEVTDTIIRPREVADVLTVAGGGTPSANLPQPAGSPGGFGTGPTTLGLLEDEGGVVLGWEWQYRPERLRRRPFLPHQRLDGLRFSTFTDPKLDTDTQTAWIGPYFHPQDHDGCQCSTAPIVAFPDLEDDVVARRLREAAQDPRNQLAEQVAAEDDAAGRVGTSLQNEVETRQRITADVERLRRQHIERTAS